MPPPALCTQLCAQAKSLDPAAFSAAPRYRYRNSTPCIIPSPRPPGPATNQTTPTAHTWQQRPCCSLALHPQPPPSSAPAALLHSTLNPLQQSAAPHPLPLSRTPCPTWCFPSPTHLQLAERTRVRARRQRRGRQGPQQGGLLRCRRAAHRRQGLRVAAWCGGVGGCLTGERCREGSGSESRWACRCGCAQGLLIRCSLAMDYGLPWLRLRAACMFGRACRDRGKGVEAGHAGGAGQQSLPGEHCIGGQACTPRPSGLLRKSSG